MPGFTSLTEFERDTIRERTQAGLTAALARGQQGERPKGLSKQALSKARGIGQLLGAGRATIYRYLARLAVPAGSNMGAASDT